ncbi:arylamine N-acetyltransferase family protein [Cryptosporangium aurantiacum]|uniref:N-hydroxyarylamine O-acetyltransferase n=1 Tax=Cryptosporangium aurantiacum TaxID=134849 RepID=A0A1M7RPJ2_9ACTN|nr:arylamine N-acetyltransferase [Cryptosporangium aurantiacum]SHN48090.1 N-hydroxyarylamine O-acetyltransferase [Cryptosporangium aurantiacum]
MNDLAAYLSRIGHTGPVAPDLPTLRALTLAHATTIPFENLDPFSGVPVRLDPDAVRAKLITDGRGGYCFEHNRLLQSALDEIGFVTGSLQARVLWGQPDDAVTSRGHKLLRVDLDGVTYLVDVGFGGQTLTAPIRLAADEEQETPHGTFRLVADGVGGWRQQSRIKDEWRTTYRFDLTPTYPVDDEAPNWYLSTFPASHFVTGLTAARPTPDGRRLALGGRDFAVHHPDGRTERRRLETVDELRAVLADELLIELPAGIDSALKSLF